MPELTDWSAVASRLREATAAEFRLLGELGRGGMAIVFAAEDIALGRMVAIKVLSPDLLAYPGMLDRFRLEARTVARLRHPNIVTIHQVAERGGLAYFVMEHVRGRSLQQLATSERPLPLDVVRSVLRQVGDALHEAHGQGVVHRDVKPANILVEDSGRAVLSDFGIARVAEQAGLTQLGHVLGTPEYMSPEQCVSDAAITGASDQYALGVVAYALLAGTPPFVGSATSVMYAHATTPPPAIVPERCPAGTWEVLARMLAKDAGKRWPDVHTAVGALERSLQPAPRNTVVEARVAGAPALTGASDRSGTGSGSVVRPRVATHRIVLVLLAALAAPLIVAVALGGASVGREEASGSDRPAAPSTAAVVTRPPMGGESAALAAEQVLWESLRIADSLSQSGDFDGASALLGAIEASVAGPWLDGRAAAPAALTDRIEAVRRRHREACLTYSELLVRRNRQAPRCR